MEAETSEKLDSNEKILYLKKLKMVGHTDQKFTVPEMKSPTFSTMPFYLPLWDNDSFSKTYSRNTAKIRLFYAKKFYRVLLEDNSAMQGDFLTIESVKKI